MEIVGHSAIEMTMNVYGHVNLSTQRPAPNQLDETLDDQGRCYHTQLSAV